MHRVVIRDGALDERYGDGPNPNPAAVGEISHGEVAADGAVGER